MRTKDNNLLDRSRYRVCLCCHVRTGTVILGIWHILMELAAIGLLLIAISHPDVLVKDNRNTSAPIQNDGFSFGKDSKIDAFTYLRVNHFNQDRLSIVLIITLLSFAVTAILIYGAIRNRPGYLMPFFCIQVFDFCLWCLYVVGFLSYAPNMKLWLREHARLPYMGSLMQMDSQYLMILMCICFVLVLSLKAYLITMVWSCYKFIHERNVLHADLFSRVSRNDAEMALPPKYEDAVRLPVSEVALPPPPPYSQ